MVQSKIREQIQAEINAKNRIKKKQSDKRLKVSTPGIPVRRTVRPAPDPPVHTVQIEKLIGI